jgi:hypothetical protein
MEIPLEKWRADSGKDYTRLESAMKFDDIRHRDFRFIVHIPTLPAADISKYLLSVQRVMNQRIRLGVTPTMMPKK